MTTRELTKELSISYGFVQSMLTDNLQMIQVSTKFVHTFLWSKVAKWVENRMTVCTEFKIVLRQIRTSLQNYNWKRKLGLWIWQWAENAEYQRKTRDFLRRKKAHATLTWRSSHYFLSRIMGHAFSLQHDNTLCDTSLLIREFLVEKNISIWHPPSPLNIGPCDFWLFPKIKRVQKKTFYHFSQRWEDHVRAADGTSERSLPEMFPIMELTLG